MRILLAAWIACGGLLAGPVQDDEKARREREIEQAIDWLEDGDQELREVGMQALRRIGADALPYIELRLAAKGAAGLLSALREIERASSSAEDRFVRIEDLAPPAEATAHAAGPDRSAVERYVQAKYAEAYRLVQKKQYQRAYDMAGALLLLEPKSGAAESLRKLRRYCDNMVMQTSLLEAKVVQQRAAYASGERVDLTLRLRNIHRSAVTIRFDRGPVASPSAGKAVVQIEVRVPREKGDVVTFTAGDEIALEAEIPIAVGAQWERVFPLDTAGIPECADFFRIYVVNVWTIPDRIETEGVPVTRRIQFEPAVVKVVPRKYAGMLEDPFGTFRRAIESKTSTREEVFVGALLLEGDQREKGIAMLVEAMKGAERPFGRVWIGNLLGFMTDRKFGDDWRRWEEWLKSRGR